MHNFESVRLNDSYFIIYAVFDLIDRRQFYTPFSCLKTTVFERYSKIRAFTIIIEPIKRVRAVDFNDSVQ